MSESGSESVSQGVSQCVSASLMCVSAISLRTPRTTFFNVPVFVLCVCVCVCARARLTYLVGAQAALKARTKELAESAVHEHDEMINKMQLAQALRDQVRVVFRSAFH